METRQPKSLHDETLSEKMKVFISFVDLVENGTLDPDAFKMFLHDEVMFYEFPNLISSKGQVRNFTKALKGVELSRGLIDNQEYKYLDWFETGDKLVVECTWSGTMAIDAGHLKKGEYLNAHICAIIEFKNGKIYRQRNYDCYEPL